MKILLTGATGFIGSHVAGILLSNGHTVDAVIRPFADLRRLGDAAGQISKVELDLSSPADIGRYLDDHCPDVCIHLAWPSVRGDLLNDLNHLDAARVGLGLATSLARSGCRRLLVAGSCFEYEFGPDPLSERSPVRPKDLYTAGKLSLLTGLSQLSTNGSLELVWPRLFFLYGPGEDRRRLVPCVVGSLLADQEANVTEGSQVRDFLHVFDAAGGIVRLALGTVTGPVNVCSGQPLRVRDLVTEVGRQLGRLDRIHFGAIPYRPNDPPTIVGRSLEGAFGNWLAPGFRSGTGHRTNDKVVA